MVCLKHDIESSRPEWCISSMIYSRDTRFWSETIVKTLRKGEKQTKVEEKEEEEEGKRRRDKVKKKKKA